MNALLSGKVLYSYADEVAQRQTFGDFAAMFSTAPFHRHQGAIALLDDCILISGDENLEISLGRLDQIYLGFDDVFPSSLVKNGGLFWQPLRIKLTNGQTLYLVIDASILGAKNKLWFDSLQELLSEKQ